MVVRPEEVGLSYIQSRQVRPSAKPRAELSEWATIAEIPVLRSAERLLEFDRLREILSRFSTCVPGRRFLHALAPRRDGAELDSEFALVREAMAYLRAGSDLGFGVMADPEAWLGRLAVPGSSLSSAELLDAASLLDAVAELRVTFRAEAEKYPRLAERVASLADFRAVIAEIRRAILPNGEISDAASSDLRRIRAALSRAREKIQQSLMKILRARGAEPGADYVTLRNNRFVIPVRASDRRAVPGVVHGASGTGQTIFVEPLEIIEINNRLVQLAEDEAAEIARILSELTERLRLERVLLLSAAESIAHLDSVFARARFAREFDACLPSFEAEDAFRLEAARNPVLEDTLRNQGKKVVPITLALGGEERIMVISGPNTGGKTVTLKTVGLAALAGQSGIPVAAERAEMPLFDCVLADIGDEQSITADLSTFSGHMLNLKNMLEVATECALVLVDEIGTGTAPEEGAALAVALLEEFRARRALTLATTHHNRLKSYASTTPGVVNAAVEFDEANLRPTFRLLVGVPGVSSGIEIARRLALPVSVIERARTEMSPEARESRELIAYLHRCRDEVEEIKRQTREGLERLEAERCALQTEWVERQRKRIAELEKRFAAAQKRLETEVASLTAEIAERKMRTQIEKQASRRLGKIESAAQAEADAAVLEQLAASQADLGAAAPALSKPIEPERLAEGMRVSVRGLKRPVVVRRWDAHAAEVEAGPLRMKIPLADITRIEAEMGASESVGAAQQRRITVHALPTEEPLTDEINVIGCTVEEAARRVDKFLDSAALAHLPRVRIIHGHGRGALRRGVAEFLTAHPLVTKFYAEAEDRGGSAITAVELKQ